MACTAGLENSQNPIRWFDGMKVSIVTPAPAHSRKGNRVTAQRWSRILRQLGHRVWTEQSYTGRRCDLMIALHARRSFPSIDRFAGEHPNLPLIVALTGTDLYGDIHHNPQAQRSLACASRLVVLQPCGVDGLPPRLREKARVIFQSATAPPGRFCPRKDSFDVCVLGHLREVKDPFRAALAARRLPVDSRISVLHVGAALDRGMARQARAEAAANPRYRWMGELPRWKALRMLARSQLLVLSSKVEGGANAISEAIATSTPIVSSRIAGAVGILGEHYPAYFPVGDTEALAHLLTRVEVDSAFRQSLTGWCRALAPLVDPARERQSWAELIDELLDAPPYRR